MLLSRIRDALRASGADLVFLQEVGGDHGGKVAQQHYELLADQVWPQHAYGRNVVAPGAHQGNALLSKFPIVHCENVDVSVDGVEPRGLLHCVLEVQQAGPPLHTVCVHLGLREAQRRWQVDRLLALLADAIPRDAPLVIAGDFNDWRELAHERMLADSSLAEIHASVSSRPARTFPAWWPWLRLDRIYVRNLLHRPLEMPRRPWSELSDHAPLAAEIRLQAKPTPVGTELPCHTSLPPTPERAPLALEPERRRANRSTQERQVLREQQQPQGDEFEPDHRQEAQKPGDHQQYAERQADPATFRVA
jgi:endonuclease/exonuclease/phosphatase family metal-dependent hydrolase